MHKYEVRTAKDLFYRIEDKRDLAGRSREYLLMEAAKNIFMFCESCEKYLNVSSLVCDFCGKRNVLKLEAKKIQHKNYSVQEVKERRKGTKIKEECPKCKSEYMYFYTMQLRSADEGQTVFYECDCGHKEKLNT